MHARTVEAAQWWAKSRGEQSAAWIANYQNSLTQRHRTTISQIVGELGVTSVLEVGCHCGPNLVRIAQDHPQIEQCSGFDVNAEAIQAGVQWIVAKGLTERIQLVPGRMPEASRTLPDQCVDVVLSCYALAYIAPADLDGMLWEMGRLAKRAVIIAEPMTERPTSEGNVSMSGYNEWAHNYQAASQWINTWRGTTLTMHSVTPPVDRLRTMLVADFGDRLNMP